LAKNQYRVMVFPLSDIRPGGQPGPSSGITRGVLVAFVRIPEEKKF
jgi:hypothetical protein